MKIISLNRTIINVSGVDAKKFLQGLISNNINLLEKKDCIYTGFFTNNGRYNFDFFVIPYRNIQHKDDTTAVILDIDSNFALRLMEQLKFYKLISKVSLEVLPDLKVFAVFDYNQEILTLQAEDILICDPRLDVLEKRLITKQSIDNFNNFLEPLESYEYLCAKNSIVESLDMKVEKSIPLEYGFDELGAIAYDKGCYLGQEFTNSSKNILAIRKRVIPFDMKANIAKKGDKVYVIDDNSNKIIVGEIIKQSKNIALILFKMQYLSSTIYYNEYLIQVLKPTWITTFTTE